jgi:hypothetical protein
MYNFLLVLLADVLLCCIIFSYNYVNLYFITVFFVVVDYNFPCSLIFGVFNTSLSPPILFLSLVLLPPFIITYDMSIVYWYLTVRLITVKQNTGFFVGFVHTRLGRVSY